MPDAPPVFRTDNGDGATTLTARTAYRLYVAPAWYFDLRVGDIIGNPRLRVMEHVRDLAEGRGRADE